MSSVTNPWLEYKQAILDTQNDFSSTYHDLKRLKPSTNGWVTGLCPFHKDKSPSFAFDKATGNWKCHAGCGEGTVFDYNMRETGQSFKEVLLAMGDELGLPRPTGSVATDTTYDYHSEAGDLLFQVVKSPGKKFWQRRPNGKGGWIKNLKGVAPILYRLPDLLSQPDEPVYITEGEKDADRLADLGLLATTSPGGAGKWKPEFADTLTGRDIIILPDNDAPGRAHAAQIVKSFRDDIKSVRIVELPDLPEKGDVSDWLDAGGDVVALETLAATAAQCQPEGDGLAAGLRRTIMISDRQMPEVIGDAWSAINGANDPPQVFISSGQLARLTKAEDVPTIQLLNEHSAYGVLIRSADWMKSVGGKTVDAEPKKTYAQDILVNPDPSLPRLDSIITTPVFDKDWLLITRPGYHREARLWYHIDKDSAPIDVPFKPTTAEFAAARSLILDDLLINFPFTADSDRAHAVAALLLPFVRRMFEGPTPMHLIEAPTPGSGKSLLAELISIVALGMAPGCTTLTTNEEENRKKLTALMSRGPSVISIDNLQGGLWSAQVAAAITAEVWEDRLLGVNQIVTFPNRALWLVSANNPKLSMEIARRCVRIRIDPGEERPWTRTKFKHNPIREWAKRNRQRLVQAVLTLIQHWLWSGAPHSKQTMGSFETWSRMIGGMVTHIGLPDFLGDATDFYEAADTETGEWKAFILAWHEKHSSTPVSVSDLLAIAESGDFVGFAYVAKSERAQKVRFAKSLHRLRGRKFDDLEVVITTDTHTKTRRYGLRQSTQELFLVKEGSK